LVGWKAWASLGRICREKGEEAAARDAYRHSADTIRFIAGNIDDEHADLRESFLGWSAVREVLDREGAS